MGRPQFHGGSKTCSLKNSDGGSLRSNAEAKVRCLGLSEGEEERFQEEGDEEGFHLRSGIAP